MAEPTANRSVPDILTQFPGPVTLHESRFDAIAMLVVTGSVTIGSSILLVYMALEGSLTGWAALAILLTASAFLALSAKLAHSLQHPGWMRLSARGFEINAGRSRHRHAWRDIARFAIKDTRQGPGIVVFDLATTDDRSGQRQKYDVEVHHAPYHLPTQELVSLLTLWREKALTDTGEQRSSTLSPEAGSPQRPPATTPSTEGTSAAERKAAVVLSQYPKRVKLVRSSWVGWAVPLAMLATGFVLIALQKALPDHPLFGATVERESFSRGDFTTEYPALFPSVALAAIAIVVIHQVFFRRWVALGADELEIRTWRSRDVHRWCDIRGIHLNPDGSDEVLLDLVPQAVSGSEMRQAVIRKGHQGLAGETLATLLTRWQQKALGPP